MSGRLVWTLIALLSLGVAAFAQGFAGLGNNAETYKQVKPGRVFQFPNDHGEHKGFRIEWWYLTANLEAEDGRTYGVQWTLFRYALKSEDPSSPDVSKGWSSPVVWMGHAAVTSAENHFVSEVRARGGIGQAGVNAAPFKAWIDDWAMVSTADTKSDALSSISVNASGPNFSYDLNLRTEADLLLHGETGFSVKSKDGHASYYYSQPHYRVAGTLNLPDGDIKVVGKAWLDREWSSQPLSKDQKGWDWFSLHFDSGEKLMGFQLRNDSGRHFTSATWVTTDGSTIPYPDGALKLTPLRYSVVVGRKIPTRWKLELGAKDINIEVSALNPQSWMDTSISYWEGPVTFSGAGKGQGYLEMTGY